MTYFCESHEYVRVEGEFGYIGITDYAQKALGNIVYVDMPDVDDELSAGDDFGACLLYTSPSPRDGLLSRMPSSA